MWNKSSRRLKRGASSLALSVAFFGTAALSLPADVGVMAKMADARGNAGPGIEFTSPGAPASLAEAPIPGCGGTITPTLSSEVINRCGAVDVEVVVTPPECTRCTRLNVVFIQVGRARAAGWMIDESLDALGALVARDGGAEPLALDIRVGVITYDTVTATVALGMTDDLESAREVLSLPIVGDAHGGYVERAARLAVEMLSLERALAGADGAVPCDIAVLFVSTSAFNIAGGLLLQNAAGIIERASVPLIVGCPELASSNCIFAERLPTSADEYTEPPDAGKLRSAVQAEAAERSAPIAVVTFDATLTQELPEGLEYIEGSGLPPPTTRSGADRKILEWRWMAPSSSGEYTVSYRAEPTALGEFKIEGGARFVIAKGPDVTLSMSPASVEVTGECAPTPPPSTETPTPATPAPSRTSTTPEPTSTTPEPTPGSVAATTYLPAAYRGE